MVHDPVLEDSQPHGGGVWRRDPDRWSSCSCETAERDTARRCLAFYRRPKRTWRWSRRRSLERGDLGFDEVWTRSTSIGRGTRGPLVARDWGVMSLPPPVRPLGDTDWRPTPHPLSGPLRFGVSAAGAEDGFLILPDLQVELLLDLPSGVPGARVHRREVGTYLGSMPSTECAPRLTAKARGAFQPA